MIEEELKPCPCCGSKEVFLEEDSIGCRIVCYGCGIGHIDHNWTKKYCIESWNKRTINSLSVQESNSILSE